MPLTDAALEPAWQEYLLVAETPTGEKLTTYSPLYSFFRAAFAAGWVARDSELTALRNDLSNALAAPAPAIPVEEPVVAEPVFVPAPESTEHDFEVASRALRAAADEARDIERIGQTPYASIAVSEAERFNEHPLSGLYRADDNRAFIGWLDKAADDASAGVLPGIVAE